MRAKVCRRYFSYFFIFMLWIANTNYYFFGPYNLILLAIGALLGVPLALVRLFEPLVWQEFKKNILCIR
jgi:apolipoprotein N-acyltransferase